MRKSLLLLLAGVALTFAGCAKNNGEETPKYDVSVTNDGYGTGKAIVGGNDADKAEAGAEVTLTATAAPGYQFRQWTVVSGGVTLSSTTAATATFTMPAGAVTVKAEFAEMFVLINGVKWAKSNVDAPGTFAANPEDAGMFYQWNRTTAWLPTGALPVSSPEGQTWNSDNTGGKEDDVWETANDPCPAGWRVPTEAEQGELFGAAVENEWVTSPANGRRFTDKTSGNTIFFPAAGSRGNDDGALYTAGGNGWYWSSTSYLADSAWGLSFGSNAVNQYGVGRTSGFTVRCVLQ